MDRYEIKIDDWERILFGQAPPAYLAEVVFRVAFVYILILVAIRFMGKRVTSELDRTDMVARVALGSSVGLAIQNPRGGLLTAILIVMIIIIVGRGLAKLALRSRRFEKIFRGHCEILGKLGVLDTGQMKKVQLTRERIFASLREVGIRQLGEISLLYLEADGTFSVLKAKEPKPGLSVIPQWDKDMRTRQKHGEFKVCVDCGAPEKDDRCKNSSGREEAVL
jgi:uncharacterized membrane protein YcaP (DUF421 family)